VRLTAPFVLLAALAAGPAAAQTSCIQTYDRSGAVVGRYCAEGLVDPGGPATEARDDDARRPARGNSAANAGRPAPPGSEIRCDGRNGRCRGTFFIR
jgi:hypothetical protein